MAKCVQDILAVVIMSESYVYYEKDGTLHIIDYDGNEIASGDYSSIEIRKWKKLDGTILNPKDIDATQTVSSIDTDGGVLKLQAALGSDFPEDGKDIYFTSKTTNDLGDGATVYLKPMTRYRMKSAGAPATCYLYEYSNDGLSVLTQIDITQFTNANPSTDHYFIYCEDTWEEQDDGLENDAQLAALFYAISEASLLNKETAEYHNFFANKFNVERIALKKKYNSSTIHRLTIKPNEY
jgi:hypothetical protein